ncbi:hypothetical protein J6590_021001 [Homalodisca vitripennis]|nr:hypothetical protein J6590_021001 [Homalodisca vitripennis]
MPEDQRFLDYTGRQILTDNMIIYEYILRLNPKTDVAELRWKIQHPRRIRKPNIPETPHRSAIYQTEISLNRDNYDGFNWVKEDNFAMEIRILKASESVSKAYYGSFSITHVHNLFLLIRLSLAAAAPVGGLRLRRTYVTWPPSDLPTSVLHHTAELLSGAVQMFSICLVTNTLAAIAPVGGLRLRRTYVTWPPSDLPTSVLHHTAELLSGAVQMFSICLVTNTLAAIAPVGGLRLRRTYVTWPPSDLPTSVLHHTAELLSGAVQMFSICLVTNTLAAIAPVGGLRLRRTYVTWPPSDPPSSVLHHSRTVVWRCADV